MIIAREEGTVELTFDVPANDQYVEAETQVKILTVVKPTREN